MRRTQIFGLTALLFLLVASSFPVAGVDRTSAHRVGVTISTVGCADPPDACKLPVKYLGEKDGCACFACEHGKATHRIISTANEDDKIKLIAKSRAR
jgi:hypothetical protein